jgi:hypothetical protein
MERGDGRMIRSRYGAVGKGGWRAKLHPLSKRCNSQNHRFTGGCRCFLFPRLSQRPSLFLERMMQNEEGLGLELIFRTPAIGQRVFYCSRRSGVHPALGCAVKMLGLRPKAASHSS